MKLIRSSTPWLVALVGGICLVVAAVSLGQRTTPTATATAIDATQLSSVFRDVAKKTLSSVVSIQVQQDAPEGGGPNIEELYERKLVLVPRETPLSLIQLENMRRTVEAGAVLLPAMPGWYHGVKTLNDLVDFVVARILDQLNIEHSLIRRWGET